MKKLFLLAILLLALSATSFAQFSQGTFHLSGASDLNYASMKSYLQYDGEKVSDEVSSSQFNISPSFGYFVADNLAIGLMLEYETESSEGESISSAMIGPYAGYFFGSSNVRPFIGADILYGSMEDLKATGFDFGAGIAVLVNNFISIDFGLSYGQVGMFSEDDTDLKLITSGVGFSGGISIYL